MLSRCERIEGGIWGLLVGDALGVPYEFRLPKTLPERDAIEMDPPRGFDRAHQKIPSGTWSDDGAQALCLLESLLTVGHFDADDFATRLLRWQDEGHFAVDHVVYDVGVTTSAALLRIRNGTPALDAGIEDVHSNGNGALMRVLPMALWHQGSDDELIRDARLSSQVTHAHERSQQCCALYCLWVRRILNARESSHRCDEEWQEAVRVFRQSVEHDESKMGELEFFIRPDLEPEGNGSGYVVDSLRGARMLLSFDGYEDVVKEAVLLGHDTDTTAAIAGGVAGVRDGLSAIPLRWRKALRGTEMVLPLLEKLSRRS